MCIMCIVSGFRNWIKSYYYFSLIFFAVLDSTIKYLEDCAAQNRCRNQQICGISKRIFGIKDSLWNPQTNKQKDMCIDKLSCCGIRNSKRNPEIVIGIGVLFADSVYIYVYV